jgi:hypothetical protein
MVTSANFNARRSPIARIRANAIQRYSVKVQELGRPKPERPFGPQKAFNDLNNRVEFPQAIQRFLAC